MADAPAASSVEGGAIPIANISRIMKKSIPANGKIAADATEAVQNLVSEFIAFITSEASDKCRREKRETMTGDDLLWAMATLGFQDYIQHLKLSLQKYREMSQEMDHPMDVGMTMGRNEQQEVLALEQHGTAIGIAEMGDTKGKAWLPDRNPKPSDIIIG